MDFSGYRFDNAYERVYDEKGLFYATYYRLGITRDMTREEAIAQLKKDYLDEEY